jgi:hypothetical protein
LELMSRSVTGLLASSSVLQHFQSLACWNYKFSVRKLSTKLNLVVLYARDEAVVGIILPLHPRAAPLGCTILLLEMKRSFYKLAVILDFITTQAHN